MITDRRLRVSSLSFLFACLSLFITAYSARNPQMATVGTAALNELQRPVQTVVEKGAGSITGLWDSYLNLVDLRDQYTELEKKYRNLEQDKATLLEVQRENERLRTLLGVAEVVSTSPIVGRVLAYDPSNWVQAVSINRGSSDGVEVGMAAMTSEGIVGQVTAVGLTSAKVLLITDHSSGVDALLQDGRVRGIVEGAGRRSLRWRFVLENEEIKPGERLVTSGMDGVYPAGLFIGRVLSVERSDAGMFQEIEVAPAVNMARLEEVLMIKAPQYEKPLEKPGKKR